MKQKLIQKMILPMDEPGKRRVIFFVKKIRGSCPIMARKLWARIMWQGTLMSTSCKTAEKRKTTKVAPVLERPTLTDGKYT